MAVVYLGLGSNLGDRAQHLAQACATLHRHPAITVQAVSSLYHTAPVGVTDQAWFLNAVARVHTALTPAVLLVHASHRTTSGPHPGNTLGTAYHQHRPLALRRYTTSLAPS